MQRNQHESELDLWRYNCRDCRYTREIGEVEAGLVSQAGLAEVEQFQQDLLWPVLKAMIRGVRIDTAEQSRLRTQLTREIAEREGWITRVLGHPLNPQSPKQMQALFYTDLQLPVVWKRGEDGKNVPTLDDNALEILKRKQPLVRALIRKIQEIRTIKTIKSNFVDMTLDSDGRMRCSYNICGTKTYRFSSSENAFGSGRNLQNIPLKKADDDSDLDLNLPDIRSLFIPDEGYEWFDVDLSKADLRTVVWESNCLEMKAMLAEGRDPYVETAREFHRDPRITKLNSDGTVNKKYDDFKKFGHGTHFLGTPQGLSQRIGLTVHEAERTQRWYFGKYPAIKEWQEKFKAEVRRTHKVENRFGYQFHFLGRIDDSTFREAIAWVPQSTTACVINRIWMALELNHPEIYVLMQVHDSLNGEVPIERREECLAAIRECGRVVIPYSDPLIIPIGLKTSTKSWGSCEG